MEKNKHNNVRYDRSFLSRIVQAEEKTKEFYCKIKTYLLSFKGIKCRESFKASTFNIGRKIVAKITMRGKTMTINLPLDVNNYMDAKFKVLDMSDKKTYANVPLSYKIRSNRALNNAIKLLDDVLKPLELKIMDDIQVFDNSYYPYKTDAELLAIGLIKIIQTKSNKEEKIVIHESISVEEANEEISDESALEYVVAEHTTKNKQKGKKVIINIDTLSKNYDNNEVVNLKTLKEKGLIPKNSGYVKVLARGILNKSLIVEADAYSLDAIKMIILTGGTVFEFE